MHISKNAIILLIFLMVGVFVSGFYEHDLWFADEPREAGIAVRMLDEGNYAIPKLGKKNFLEKPPLYYWAGAGLLKINADTWSVTDIMRLNSVLWGVGTLFLTFWLALIWARNWPNPNIQQNSYYIAFLSALLLATCNGFITNAHTIRTDIALTFFIVLTAIGFAEAYVNKKQWGSLLAAIGLVGGFLSKGLVAIAIGGLIWLVLIPFFIKLWHDKKTFLVWHLLLPIVVFITGIGLWIYLLIHQGGQNAWETWFVENSLTRFSGGGKLGHEEPWNFLYYVEPFLIYTLPWGALWIITLAINYRSVLSTPYMRTLQLWVILPLVFLCIATTKRPVYLLPLLPLFAIAAVFLWNEMQSKWFTLVLKALAILFLVFMIATIIFATYSALAPETYFSTLADKLWLLPTWSSVILTLFVLFYFVFFNKQPVIQLCSMLLFFILCANLMVFPAQNAEKSRPYLEQEIAHKGGAEEWVKTYDSYMTEGLQGYLYIYYKYIPK